MNKRFLISLLLICLLMFTCSVSFARKLSTETRDGVTYYGVEHGCTLVFPPQYTLENSEESPDATQITENVARVKGVGPFRINVINTQNNEMATIDFFSWNVLLDTYNYYGTWSGSYNVYSSPGGSSTGSIKSKAWIAGELTSDGKYFKILDCFADSSGKTAGEVKKDSSGNITSITPVPFTQNAKSFIGKYVTSYVGKSSYFKYYLEDNNISFDIEESKLTNWSDYTPPEPTPPAGDAPEGHTIVPGYSSNDHVRGPLCDELTNNYTHFFYCEVADCDYKYEENHTYGSDGICTVCGKSNGQTPSPTPTQAPTPTPTQKPTPTPSSSPVPTPTGTSYPDGHDKVGQPSDHGKSTQFISSGNDQYHYYACKAKDKGCNYKYAEGHTDPKDWQKDTDFHYKICANQNCTTLIARGNHTFGSDNKCTVCGYTKGGAISPTPTPTPTQTPEPTDHTHDYGTDFKCKICGKLNPNHTGEGEHKASSTWSSDYKEHFKKCANINCNAIIEKGYHSFVDGKCSICGYESGGQTTPTPTPTPSSSPDEVVTGDFEIESYMRPSKELDSFAIALRNESPSYEKSNKNIYGLGESIKYSIDFRNGGATTSKAMKVTLTLPLSFEVVGSTDGKVDTSKRTITWTLPSGILNGEGGTKSVTIKYKSLKSSSMTVQTVYPVATVQPENNYSASDTSAVINVIFKNENTVITEEHEPYMIGDANGRTFRPNDGISRAEGALVLARVFGINYAGTAIQGNEYDDLNETYTEAQKAIVACSKLGLISGFGDGTYRPNDKMTNAQFMKIIACFVELKAQEDNVKGIEVKPSTKLVKEYKDPTSVYFIGTEKVEKHWAIEYITLLTRLNMTPVSDENKDLKLDITMTRAEVARLINLYLIRAPQSKGTSSFDDVSSSHELLGDILEASLPSHTYKLTRYGTEVAQ